jgi:2-C-methyl-D-erythritol 4-phosphate cytidylyltransferase/2-C-methyl-D-erythritol 2,4-cyclodiphosphate synthase
LLVLTETNSRRAAVAALIVAAGRGLRAGGDLPKQYRALVRAGQFLRRP